MIKKIIEDYDYKELYGDYDEEDSIEDIIPDYLIIEDGVLKECIDKNVVNVGIPNSVTKIDVDAFYECTSLKSITIPNSVTEIGYYAFRCCNSLKSIDIPNSVTEIGNWAFSDCESLKSIDIPNSVKCIGSYAFWKCESLKSIDIPDGVTEIGEYAFKNCPNLTIRCNKGSYAEKYAIDRGINIEYI